MVEAPDALDPRADLVVIAPYHCDVRKGPHAVDDGVRVGAVSNQIAEHEHGIGPAARLEGRVERLEVRVNVAEDEIPHRAASSELHPVEQPLDHIRHTSGRVHTYVGLGVGELPSHEQELHLRAI